MKKILLFIVIISTFSCSKYTRFDSTTSKYLQDQNMGIEKVQFYNANRVVLWKNKTKFDNQKKGGKIKTETTEHTLITNLKDNHPIIVAIDTNNENILLVKPDPKSNNTLRFMKLSEAPKQIKEEFLKIYKLNQFDFQDELYYLIPEKIFLSYVDKDIYSESGFLINLFKPKRKNLWCGTINWDGKEHQIYFKSPTFLKISKKDKKKHITKNKKLKGNYIQD